MKTQLKKLIAVAGLALVVSPAMAGVTWKPAGLETLFEDNSLDFALEVCTTCDGYEADDPTTWTLVPDSNGTLDPGDVLVAVVEFETSAAQSILPDELTGISVIQFAGFTPAGTLNFVAYEGGLNAVSPVDVTGGEAGGDAMLALWLDSTPDLNISAGLVPDALSCATLDECLAQASDGTLFQVDGIVDGQNNYWYAFGTGTSFTTILTSSTGSGFGGYSAGLSIIENNTGVILLEDGLTGTAVGNGGLPVDVLVTGNINGGGATSAAATAELQTLIDTGYVATDDADMTKIRAVPEPGTLVLLGAGLLGLGFRRRRA